MESAKKSRAKFNKPEHVALYENFVHKHQLLVPEFGKCSTNFLTQIQMGQKHALRLSEARHFCLPYSKTLPVSSKDLYRHCKGSSTLTHYIPDDCVPDRLFLLQLIATLELEHLVELTRQHLLSKKAIAKELKQPEAEVKDAEVKEDLVDLVSDEGFVPKDELEELLES